jgi:hypothetical protein
MQEAETPPARLAPNCRYLQMTFGSTPEQGLINLCRHMIRDGSSCVGPFLDETETSCGLWEEKLPGVLRSEGWRP